MAPKTDVIEQLRARIAELEAEVERLSAAHVKACQANADSQAELAKTEQRVAEAERDASRYRFLRDTCEMTRSFRMKGEFKNEDGDLTEYEWNSGPSAIYFDKSIDAEMARLNGASS